MKSARELIGPHIPAFVARPDNVVELRKAAAINRAEARLNALKATYEDQCDHISVELAREIESLERGW